MLNGAHYVKIEWKPESQSEDLVVYWEPADLVANYFLCLFSHCYPCTMNEERLGDAQLPSALQELF
jgi:hypothetical protein